MAGSEAEQGSMNKILSTHFRDPEEIIVKDEPARPKAEPEYHRPPQPRPGELSKAEIESEDSAESEDEYQ